MGSVAHVIIRLGIRSKLGATLRASPRLRSRHECPTDAVPPSLRQYEPTFQVGHAGAPATLGIRSYRHLGESEYLPIVIFGEEHGPRAARKLAGEEPVDFFAMLSLGILRPKRMALLQPRVRIARTYRSYCYHLIVSVYRHAAYLRADTTRHVGANGS